MRRLNLDPLVNTGGHRRSVNDLNYLQESIYDVVKALGTMVGNSVGGPVILGDFQLRDNGSTFDLLNQCAVFYQNKIYFVNAATGVAKSGAGGAEYKFQIVSTPGPDNPVSYQSGSPFNVHLTEDMQLVHTNLTGSTYVPLTAFNTGWVTVSSPVTTGLTIDDPGQFVSIKYKRIGKTLNLWFRIVCTVDGVTYPSFNLPNGYKLKENIWQICGGFHTSGPDNNLMVVYNGGGNPQLFFSPHDGTNFNADDNVDIRGSLTFEIE